MKSTIIAQDKEHLQSLIENEMRLHGNACNLNHINTSLLTDMNSLFCKSTFNGDISKWDVSNVINISYMFYESQFNGDICQWNVNNVTDMSYLFYKSQFNNDVNKWHVEKVENMKAMFEDSPCQKPWWAIEDNQQRQIAIDNFRLMQKLNTNLMPKDMTQPKKKKFNDENYNHSQK